MDRRKIKMVSWNVNGMNAVMKKDFPGIVRKMDADVVAIQETKLQEIKLTPQMRDIEGYTSYWAFSTVKKGYSGVAIYTRIAPRNVSYGIGQPVYDDEGRIIGMDFGAFVFFNVYFPNGQMSDERLQYKLNFYAEFFAHADAYRKAGRTVIVTGDFNTAHNAIDLKNPKANQKTSGFLKIEREVLDELMANGYVDTFRYLYPDTVKYSWWTYRFKARERNAGWRIDAFYASRDLVDKQWLKDAFIDNDVHGSDHCPVGLELELEMLPAEPA